MEKVKCIRCEHEWIPRVVDPVECPKCKRRDWGVKRLKQEEAF